MRVKVMLSVLFVLFFLASCNMPVSQVSEPQSSDAEQVSSDADGISTVVALTAAARLLEIANSATVTFPSLPTDTPVPTQTLVPTIPPTQCSPQVTANVVANVRSGPNTAYDVVGTLSEGQSATVAGRNDANTWWYIDYPAGSGNHAWIAGSVTTAACLPAAVQVVAAPPFPTSVPQADASSDEEDNNSSGTPDLVAYAMQYAPNGKKVSVQVSVKNNGDAIADGFTVQWLSNQDILGCTWEVQGLGAGKTKNLECQYEYQWGANQYWSVLVVDTGNRVTESNEGNNRKDFQVNLQ